MAHTVNQSYALVSHQNTQLAELWAENKELRTITEGLRGDISRLDGKVRKADKLARDNLERSNVTSALVEFIHLQEKL